MNGKNRITTWNKAEGRSDSSIHCYTNDRHLFKEIRDNEIKTYMRDEAEGTNALIDAETTRLNKRIHPKHKIIEKVWAPLVDQGVYDDVVDGDDSDHLGSSRPMLFDPTYLEVERIIGERDDVSSDGVVKKEYLIKWTNQPYAAVTWEDYHTAKDDFIFQEHIDRFKRSLRFPTSHEIQTGKAYLNGDARPRLEIYSAANPPPPFLGGKQLKDYQIDGVNWMCTNFYIKRNSILAGQYQ